MQQNLHNAVPADVIKAVYEALPSLEERCQAYKQGTTETLYRNTVTKAVDCFMTIPIVNVCEDNEHFLEMTADDVSDLFSEVVAIVCSAFDKPSAAVHTDVKKAVDDFPSNDLREAITLRRANRII